jgi:hypothetical protein
MPTILCLLLLALPIVAAVVLDIGTFVSFLLLFCVAAGLTTSASDDSAFFEDAADKNRCRHKSRLDVSEGRRAPPLNARSASNPMSTTGFLEFSRF